MYKDNTSIYFSNKWIFIVQTFEVNLFNCKSGKYIPIKLLNTCDIPLHQKFLKLKTLKLQLKV